jgi:hypothetical protein
MQATTRYDFDVSLPATSVLSSFEALRWENAFCPEDRLIVSQAGSAWVLEFGRFQSVARSGQNSLAQGLPWVSRK